MGTKMETPVEMTNRRRVNFITGIAGQDGSYLAEHLIGKGEAVCGIVRRNSTPEHQSTRIAFLEEQELIRTTYGDLTDPPSLVRALREFKPDRVFNLASQSHVRVSFDVPRFTFDVNAVGVLNMLEACRAVVPQASFYQASSSEMFGNSVDDDGFQRLTTPMQPVSPYGCAKLAAFHLVRHYRQAYGMHACNGVLFNHESPRRGSNFVTAKVCKRAVEIANGKGDGTLWMGNLDSERDWGHAADYVQAMDLILDYETPRDWLIATGTSHSIRDLLALAFRPLGLDWRLHVQQDPQFMRPDELKFLRGDSTESQELLGWTPTRQFAEIIEEIVNHWQEVLKWDGK